MCSRYVLLKEHLREVLGRLGVPLPPSLAPSRYNVPPGGAIPVIRAKPGAAAGSPDFELAALRWGFVPGWAREPGAPLVNARAETLATKPTFRDAFRQRRCLIPVTGFYEWKREGRSREPWYFHAADATQPLGLAGIWESWASPDGASLETCAVVTTAPNALMEPIHNRMPVILDAADWARWMMPTPDADLALSPLLRPCDDAALHAHRVDRKVNHVQYENPDCIAPARNEPTQLGFFS